MDIVFSETNQTGIIKLNRPKALNALNLEMAKKFHDKLLEWEEKDNILRVLLVGEGKHFCAGGDVKSLVLAGKENSLKHDFFKIEYKLNYLISQFSKEFLSVWNGVVMGGGVGLSIYGDHRLATDNSKFAMPESAIGFFPDVGGSYFLSNLPGNIGKYIGLTGEVLGLNELIFFNTTLASDKLDAMPDGQTFTLIFSIDSLNNFLSSALLIALKSAPINSTLFFFKKSDSDNLTARFKAV